MLPFAHEKKRRTSNGCAYILEFFPLLYFISLTLSSILLSSKEHMHCNTARNSLMQTHIHMFYCRCILMTFSL